VTRITSPRRNPVPSLRLALSLASVVGAPIYIGAKF
jgi:hypothetical protein